MGFFEYYKARWHCDVNMEYTLSKRFKLFANARNIFNAQQIIERYSDVSAAYAAASAARSSASRSRRPQGHVLTTAPSSSCSSAAGASAPAALSR